MATLEGQVVLVTGCSTGIGRALARELAGRGHQTFASARQLGSIADLEGHGIHTLELDVTSPASIDSAVGTLLSRAGRIDAVINNAGVNVFGPILETPLDAVRGLLETNVLGALAVAQAVFPHMAERRAGRIVNIGSIAGVLPTPFAAAYCASKSALHMLSEVMRMEVKPFGIDIVVVQPGGVKSNIASSGSRDIGRYAAPSSRYQRAYNGIQRRANASQDNPMPAEDFAREVVAQAFAGTAPRIIRAGTGVEFLSLLAERAPDERDALLSQTYDLTALD
ncbi:MAG TPA: SDR family oxidoreductase [Polyangiaceae bacterium]|nr:SDR family oxidoreductase [Polyangiaceae bacterium]